MNFLGQIEAAVTVPAGGWTFSATNLSGGPSTCTLAAGTYFITDSAVNGLITAFQAALNAGRPSSWVVTLSTGLGGDGRVTITGTGSWSITFTSAELGSVLGFASNPSGPGAITGNQQCAALWFPDCPLALNGDPRRQPMVSDARSTISPNYTVMTLVGNVGYRHKGLRYTHVPLARVWESAATYANASWEGFLKNTQLAQGGFSNFAPGTPFQIFDHTGWMVTRQLGQTSGGIVNGWQFSPAISSIEPGLSIDQFTGLWRIDLPDIVSSG